MPESEILDEVGVNLGVNEDNIIFCRVNKSTTTQAMFCLMYVMWHKAQSQVELMNTKLEPLCAVLISVDKCILIHMMVDEHFEEISKRLEASGPQIKYDDKGHKRRWFPPFYLSKN